MLWVVIFGTVAIVGIAGSFGLFGLVAAPLSRTRRTEGNTGPEEAVDVLIPAHNEEAVIAATVGSVRAALARIQAHVSSVRLIVGANGCQDRTAETARAAGAEVKIFDAGSKWGALRTLLQESQAPIVAFADAGARWPADLAARAILAFRADMNLIAYAPAYMPGDGGGQLWRIESFLKSIENFSGGPVSVHGATVFYRRSALNRALAALGTTDVWLNDDVVLPLLARARAPQSRIQYDSGATVRDSGGEEGPRAEVRRLRMVAGNLQWLPLLPNIFRADTCVGCVALRRAFRVFWAWWVLAAGIALWFAATPASALVLPLRVAVIAYLLSPFLAARGVRAAFLASLRAPLLLASGPKGRKVEWK